MFIMTKRNIELPSSDGSQKYAVKKDFIGNIPEWAADTAYFRALVGDGKIVVPASTKDKDLTAVEDEPGQDKTKQPEDEPGQDKIPAKTSSKKGK